MESTSWFKQTNKPLFPDLLWSRPENKRYAGKLLILGGNLHAISTPAVAYTAATNAGIGTCRVVLPDATKKLVEKIFPEAEFAASTPSGSFARESLAQLLDSADWADGILFAGDFGRNSETAIVLEDFAKKYKGQITIAQDSLDYFLSNRSLLFERAETTSVINFGGLQKLSQNNKPNPPIRHSMDLRQLVEVMQQWTAENQVAFITNHADMLIAACGGKVSTTPLSKELNWQIELAAFAATWQLQQPQKTFEAITTAIFDYIKV